MKTPEMIAKEVLAYDPSGRELVKRIAQAIREARAEAYEDVISLLEESCDGDLDFAVFQLKERAAQVRGGGE